MPSSSSISPTVWLARGRYAGSGAADVLRRTLRLRKDSGALDDFYELPESGTGGGPLVVEARWRVDGPVTVRSRLTLDDTGRWTLVAEAEAAWELHWPSPATLFWPEDDDAWAHDCGTELRLREINPLPSEEERDLRQVLKAAAHDPWTIHVVVHEAMTVDERGLRPLAAVLPPGLRHRVVEHRAAPQQLRPVNWALREAGVEVPRGGAVVLPGVPAPPGYTAEGFTVRSVFLDGSQPAELISTVTRFAALFRWLPDDAEPLLTALRDDWQLLTVEEELDRERRLVAMYVEALEAMTTSRDLYREAADSAHEALAAYRETYGDLSGPARPAETAPSPLRQLTQTFGRLRLPGRRTDPGTGADGVSP